ncbi:hypothetical protein ADK86_21375 [Streptomyces sp. NRRL F-5755]|uniref:hypothetical protein n=1 Tax=Streptomyces sp. NRRL F-5755 TaxID=1519475 RepID=UPI0006AF8021|nr:hypothetical protein [Streptomyces sp. NRRL F-5755]KOT92104.1 hypothetical protein ADK86_21375 [Streptomyces sp. NRRL F-5755]
MNGYLVTGDLLMGAALFGTARRGRPLAGRRRGVRTAALVAFGGVLLGAGRDPAVMVCAVSALGAAAVLLADMTTVRRSVLAVAWSVAAGALTALNLGQEQSGSWVAERKPWVTVSALAVLGGLAAAAVATARLARDPDVGPGGV